jgi:hypothetical protein
MYRCIHRERERQRDLGVEHKANNDLFYFYKPPRVLVDDSIWRVKNDYLWKGNEEVNWSV